VVVVGVVGVVVVGVVVVGVVVDVDGTTAGVFDWTRMVYLSAQTHFNTRASRTFARNQDA